MITISRWIPNENCWIGFVPEVLEDLDTITAAQITDAVELTEFCASLNASSQGNLVPTPNLKSLFETSINGTVQASFTADFYRDSDDDVAWDTLPRAQKGTFLICRFGVEKGEAPGADDPIEAWPVIVSSRTASNLTSNTAQTFTINCGVLKEPNENATITA